MNKIKKILIAAALITTSFSGTALAIIWKGYDYGRWMCETCGLPTTGAYPTDGSLEQITTFIKVNNNHIFNATNQRNQWRPLDKITIYDGTTCVTMVFGGNGNWVPSGPAFKDNGRTYKNANARLDTGVVGGAGSQFSVIFRGFDYSGTVAYERTRTVTVETTLPRRVENSFGNGFSTGFSWGEGAISSDGWAAQGGHCSISGNGSCLKEY